MGTLCLTSGATSGILAVPAYTTAMLQLLTLGRSDLVADSPAEQANGTMQPKRLALLAFLAVDGGGAFHRRDTLMALFWPELDDAHARAALRKALHHLRRSVGESIIVTRGAEEVRVDPNGLWCDARALDALAGEGKHEDAVALYGGEFLPGLHLPDAPDFERWADAPRQRLRAIALECAIELARKARESGSPDIAVRWARHAVEIAPLDEAANRALIEALAANAEGAAAVSAYERFTELLARELDVGPDRKMRAMVERLRETVPAIAVDHMKQPRPSASPADAVVMGQRVANPTPRSRRQMARLALGVLAATSALGLVSWRAVKANGPARHTLSVAVLPLQSTAGDTDQRYIAEGVQNALIAELSQNSSLRVIPRASANRYVASGKPIARIARELSLGGIVSGAVERRHDSIEVRLRLLDRDGHQSWARTYRGPVRELPILGAEAASAVAEELRAVGDASVARAERRIEPDSKAFEAWLKGSYHADRRTTADIEQCIRFGNEAVATDPTYARGYDLLAQCYILLPFVADAPPRMMFDKAKAAARRALALDDSLSSAHAALAYTLAAGEWDWPAAEREYWRAVEFDPRSQHVREEFAFFLSWIGRHDDAIAQVRLAEQFDPISPETATRAAMVYYLASRNDEAIAEAKRALAIDPNFMFGWDRLHWAYAAKGMIGEAVAAAEQAARVAGQDDSRRRAFVAHAYASAGRRAEAQAILKELLDRRRETYVSPIAIAAVYVGLGDKSNAIAWLERAYEVHDGGLVLLASFPLWAPLHGEAGYESLRRRLKL